jgi:parallel beta-helix repeat protein
MSPTRRIDAAFSKTLSPQDFPALRAAPKQDHTVLENIGVLSHAEIDAWTQQVRVNVKVDFGATGDGVTDDTAAIQAALDAVEAIGGGYCFLPFGTYLISAPLDVAAYVTIEGSGWGSVITLADNSDCNLITQTTGRENDYAGVRNLKVSGNKANQASGHGIYAFASDRFLVENCWIVQCKEDGIKIDSDVTYTCEQPRIINNYILSNDGIGVNILGYSSDADIHNNDIGQSGDKGIVMATSAHVLTGNKVWGSLTTGIQGFWCQGLTITGNRVDYNLFHGIQLHGVKNSTVSGNAIYLNSSAGSGSYDGIHVSAEAGHTSSDINISGNMIGLASPTELQRYGVHVADSLCDYVTCLEDHNHIRYNVTDQIFVAAGANTNGVTDRVSQDEAFAYAIALG